MIATRGIKSSLWGKNNNTITHNKPTLFSEGFGKKTHFQNQNFTFQSKRPLMEDMLKGIMSDPKLLKMVQDQEKIQIDGEAGGGLVKITLNGALKLAKIKIDPSLMNGSNAVLEDLLLQAHQNAHTKHSQKMAQGLLGGGDLFSK